MRFINDTITEPGRSPGDSELGRFLEYFLIVFDDNSI